MILHMHVLDIEIHKFLKNNKNSVIHIILNFNKNAHSCCVCILIAPDFIDTLLYCRNTKFVFCIH